MMGATVIGDEALAAKFTAAATEIIAEQPYWLNDVAIMVEESILDVINLEGLIGDKVDKPRHPHLADTGRIFYRTVNGISVGFGKGHPAALALEHGVGPHPIFAKNPTGLLHFFWEERGQWFVGPVVNHPGNRPYKYVERGAMNAFIPIAMYFFNQLKAVFGGL